MSSLAVAPRTLCIISAEESTQEWGLKKGRDINIRGDNLTDEKIAAVMNKAALYLNQVFAGKDAALAAHGQFMKFCREQKVEFTLK